MNPIPERRPGTCPVCGKYGAMLIINRFYGESPIPVRVDRTFTCVFGCHLRALTP